MDDIRVFLSSTSVDLDDERKAVESVIRRMHIPYMGMELFGSDPLSPEEVCIKTLRQCSIYIGVVGFRYGSLVSSLDVSFTELEYEEAHKAGLPQLIYLKKKDAKIRFDKLDLDKEKVERLNRFRSSLESKHVVSYFLDEKELASMVAADLHRLLIHKGARTELVEETDIFQVPRVLIKRAEMTLSNVVRFCNEVYNLEKKNELTRMDAQERVLNFLRTYRFRFDGEFTIFNTDRITIFHNQQRMVGRYFSFIDVNFTPMFEKLYNFKDGGTLKWIDELSSDYLIVNDVFYSNDKKKEWIRFNIAPFVYFEFWGWYILVEAHNEIHGLDKTSIHDIMEEFKNKGWFIIDSYSYR